MTYIPWGKLIFLSDSLLARDIAFYYIAIILENHKVEMRKREYVFMTSRKADEQNYE
jgi:hypothetical protein